MESNPGSRLALRSLERNRSPSTTPGAPVYPLVVWGTCGEARLPRIVLADSALAAPGADFGGQDAYPGPIEKAAVLVEHLARNHPLPDGNKRGAFLAAERFLAANADPPSTARAGRGA